MAEVKWIKITTNMFEDEKIDFIESLPESDAILVIWIKLLTLAGKANANGFIFLTEQIPYTDEMLSHKFRRPLSTVKLALNTFKKLGMVDYTEDGFLRLSNWEKHQNIQGLEKIKEQTRKRVADYRKRQKELPSSNVTCNATVTQGNATDIDIDIEKEYSAFFEEVWKLYPNKKGKSKISNSKKKELYKYKDQIKICIERYIRDKPQWQEWQNGSTFFNKGFEDYLDENYLNSGYEEEPRYNLGSEKYL